MTKAESDQINVYSVVSSNISMVGFKDGQLVVHFKNGTSYCYEATHSEFEALRKADSVGKHFNRVFRSRSGQKIEDDEE